MAIKIKMDVEPFVVPSVVTVINLVKDCDPDLGLSSDRLVKQSNTFPLSTLDYYGLDELCRDFRREVFKKAKVRDIDPIVEQKQRNDDNSYGK